MTKIIIVFAFLVLISLSGCTANLDWDSLCSADHFLYAALNTNKDTWSNHFTEREYNTPIVIKGGFRDYIVDSLSKTEDDQPIISISVDDGIPATRLGVIGIVYVPGDNVENFGFGEHEIRLISNEIYCYRLTQPSR